MTRREEKEMVDRMNVQMAKDCDCFDKFFEKFSEESKEVSNDKR